MLSASSATKVSRYRTHFVPLQEWNAVQGDWDPKLYTAFYAQIPRKVIDMYKHM